MQGKYSQGGSALLTGGVKGSKIQGDYQTVNVFIKSSSVATIKHASMVKVTNGDSQGRIEVDLATGSDVQYALVLADYLRSTQSNYNNATEDYKNIEVIMFGRVVLEANSAIAVGVAFEMDLSTGKIQAHNTGTKLGYILQASTADGDKILCHYVSPYNSF